jgi:hypothetical protein
LVKAGQEAVKRKMDKWNKELLYPAAYLDPMMRYQTHCLAKLMKFDTNKVVLY